MLNQLKNIRKSIRSKEQEIKNKLKEKWIKKYGVDCPAKSKYHQDKIRASIKTKYGVDNVYQIPEVINKIQEKNKINQKEITNKTKETFDTFFQDLANKINEKSCRTIKASLLSI